MPGRPGIPGSPGFKGKMHILITFDVGLDLPLRAYISSTKRAYNKILQMAPAFIDVYHVFLCCDCKYSIQCINLSKSEVTEVVSTKKNMVCRG